VDDYDFENENDISQFCPNAALSEGQDGEYGLDNAGKSAMLSTNRKNRQFIGNIYFGWRGSKHQLNNPKFKYI